MAHKLRQLRTDEELRKVTNHLFYEWKMLVFCAEELLKVPNQLFQNVLIESGAIHARNLVKFFYPYISEKEPRKSDPIAHDFFEPRENWDNICPPMPKNLTYQELGGHADLQIAHIVYEEGEKERFVAYGHYDWNHSIIADELQPIFEKFISAISKEVLGNRWTEILDEQKGYRWERLKVIVNEKNSKS